MTTPILAGNMTEPEIHRIYSPLTLSSDWSKIARFLLTLFCTSFGTTVNGFFVASFFVEHSLKSIGNIYLACAGFADLLVTAGAIAVSAVVLLSGEWDNIYVCRTVQLSTETATYAYSLFFLLVALENYYRTCRTSAEYQIFLSMRIGCVSILVYCMSFILAFIGIFLNLDYDYCQREFHGILIYRITSLVLFYVIPAVITMSCLITANLRVKRRARNYAQYRRSRHFQRDYSITSMNIAAYVLFAVAWIPYLVVVYVYPDASDAIYYNTVWLGLLRPVFTSFIYGVANRSFKRAFAHIFNYCFCKSNLSSPFASIRRRRAIGTRGVRAHVMHEIVASSPYRGASTSCETRHL